MGYSSVSPLYSSTIRATFIVRSGVTHVAGIVSVQLPYVGAHISVHPMQKGRTIRIVATIYGSWFRFGGSGALHASHIPVQDPRVAGIIIDTVDGKVTQTPPPAVITAPAYLQAFQTHRRVTQHHRHYSRLGCRSPSITPSRYWCPFQCIT